MISRLEFKGLTATDALGVSEILEATENPTSTAVAVDEYDANKELWSASAYYAEQPSNEYLNSLANIVATALGDQQVSWAIVEVPEENWVKKSLEGLTPVEAGRFFVHGSHDHHLRAVNRVSIELEAGMAFGTGHHGTTKGCLIAFDELFKHRKLKHVLDVGTGTGILAIAAALTLKSKIIASDIDPIAVEHAHMNARHNGVGNLLKPVVSNGLNHNEIRANGPYDLIFANILARPLAGMAKSIGGLTAPGGSIILSGILPHQSLLVETAYRAQGFVVSKRYNLENWVTLLMHV